MYLLIFTYNDKILEEQNSKYIDELFEYIEILIDEELPYLSELNVSITPFENVRGVICQNVQEKSKKEICNSLLRMDGSNIYYFPYNDKMNVVYFDHLDIEGERGIKINDMLNSDLNNMLQNKIFKCDDQASYKKNTITYYDDNKIEISLNNNKSIIAKQMSGINNINIDQSSLEICEILDEIVKNAKPIQFPYNNFYELNEFESKAPISTLFAHLFYKHNDTNEGSFKDIVNECCDIIDDILIPDCANRKNIKFTFDKCDPKSLKMKINYLNCKPHYTKDIPETIDCQYLPYANYKGLSITILSIVSFVIEFFLLIFIILNRDKKCIHISGMKFMIYLILSSIILDCSVNLWIGEKTNLKCIIGLVLMVIGITVFICSYTIKSEIIINIYNNQNVLKKKNLNNYSIIYIIIPLIQLILLLIWAFTDEGSIKETIYIENIGYNEVDSCSIGNKGLLKMIFVIDIILVIFSIIISYQGRKIPDEFNESRKVYLSSIISSVMITLCYISVFDISSNIYSYILMLALLNIIPLVTNKNNS
ncbi:hypothetical protein BCR32DRAFT_277050 [Anaeromyces robustus]|uniref:G-protein coupled receptors family 3 profile domain-containing protein n=1 Tax=Anaeromyces robustus TaxID=1754192 RepID=A0A1Y1XFL7_9FUNG|nr:hypothetical protein BCR32DRAFT_277050 [Anaeromyces robustus]|eukprot:ORX84545.1 hypothetical protein BCR32DRAFT_277050 [Anaeromyces robustus]